MHVRDHLNHPAIWVLTAALAVNSIPFQYFFLGLFILLLITIFRSRPTIKELVEAVNSIGTNPMALMVLVIGCIMLIVSKINGLDSTVSGTIIGYGGNMLQSQIRDVKDKPGTKATIEEHIETNTPPEEEKPKEDVKNG